jgi:predicted ribosomally synthesized peptide with nif11-like leader
MSQQHAHQFIQKVQVDEALRADVLALGSDMVGVAALAARHNFTFSATDLQAAMRSNASSGPMQLGEAELENIAGGSGTHGQGWTGCATGQAGCTVTVVMCTPPPTQSYNCANPSGG